jgi:hypothetical protein
MAAFLVLFLFLLFWNIGMLMAASCDERTSIVVASKKMNRFGRRWTVIEEDEQRLHVYVFVYFLNLDRWIDFFPHVTIWTRNWKNWSISNWRWS